jgi:hypothetical protein
MLSGTLGVVHLISFIKFHTRCGECRVNLFIYLFYFCIAAVAMSRCSSSGVMDTHVPSGMLKNEGRSSELGPEITAVWASWLAKSGHFRGTHPDTFVRMRVDFGVGYT